MSGVPTGTVTFLFTDIEGSTRLLKTLRENYGALLAEHGRLLREAFAGHGGHEVDTQGDSFFVVFRRAKDAVAAAVDGQRALAAHAWPDGAAVRVRMGIHTGEAALAGDRYVGVAVHRAARIAAAAHGGQILISQITHDLLHDEEADLEEVQIRDLGEQRLKDLDRPVRLYQVAAAGLPHAFPPLNTADRVAEREIPARAGGPEGRTPASRSLLSRRRAAALVTAAAALVAAAAIAVAATGGDEPPPIVAGSLVRMDAQTTEVREVYELGGAGVGDIVVSGHAVWVAKEADGTLWRLDTRSGRVTPVGLAARGAVSAGGGRIWVPQRDPTRIVRVNPDTLRVDRTVRVKAAVAEPIVYGGGSLWAVVPASTGDAGEEWDAVVLRIDPRSGRVKLRRRVGFTAWWAAYGEGALWVTNHRPDRLTRIDALAETVDGRPLQFGPERVVVADRAVWVTHFASQSIVRVDPVSLEIEDVIALQEPAPDIAVGGGSVWVTQPARKELLRFDAGDGSREETVRLPEKPWSVELAHGALWLTVGVVE